MEAFPESIITFCIHYQMMSEHSYDSIQSNNTYLADTKSTVDNELLSTFYIITRECGQYSLWEPYNINTQGKILLIEREANNTNLQRHQELLCLYNKNILILVAWSSEDPSRI